MYKDPGEFRERFKAYKDGKSVREIYGLPGYAEGTVGTDPELDMIKKFEQWRDKTYLDSKNIPTIGWGFTDTSLVSKGKMSREEGDRYLQKIGNDAKKYLRNKLGPRIWDNLDTTTKAALLSYHHNYPAGFGDNTRFMKHWRAGRYNEAVSEIDAGMNDPTSPGLKPRRLEEQATIRKDSFLFPKIKPQKPADALVQKPDVTKVAAIPTIQQQAIDYADRRNSVVAEAERAMWAHNVMDDMKGAYQVPILESHSLPALEPIELDVTPFKYNNGKLPGYQLGKAKAIQQGRKQIPIDKAEAATEPDYNEGWFLTTIKRGVNNAIKTVKDQVRSARNIVNGRGDWFDWLNVGTDVVLGAGGKAVKGAAKEAKAAVKTIKPKKSSAKFNTKDPNKVGAYYTAHPEEVTPITNSEELNDVVNFMNTHIAPKYARQNKVHIGIDPADIKLGSADLSGTNLGGYVGPSGEVVINQDILNNSDVLRRVLGHEVAGHWFDLHYPLNPSQASIVQNGVRFNTDFLNSRPWFDQFAEGNAERRLFNYLSSRDNGNVVGSELDAIINSMPRAQAKRYADMLGYNKGIEWQWPDILPFKQAATSVPTIGIPLYAGTQIDRQYKNGKLPGYKNGKIRIKSSNRGKFNATKKRTGKTTEELTHSKNPLTRKRAIFAQNARKWHHADGKLPGYKNGVFPWGEDDTREKTEQWADDWASRVTASRVLKEWNKTGVKPKAESSDEYTNRRVKEETKRTWLSDAADISHGIGEAVMAMNPYTAIPYFGAKIGTDVINGNVGMHTALDATAIAGNWLFNYINPNSLLNQNIRTALYNNKIPYGYNLLDINIPKSYIEGSIEALRGNKIQQLAKPNWFNKSGNILGSTSEASARPLTEMHQNHRAAAWARYLGLDDTLQGVGYIPSRKNWVTKTRDPYFENAYREQIYEKLQKGHSSQPTSLLKGTISDKSVYNTAGGMGYEINPSTGVVRIFDVWDLQPFKNLNIPILKNFEASQILPGAKPFNFETFVSIPR